MKIALVLLILPLAAVGHDVYHWYSMQNDLAIFRLSELGWLLIEYVPDFYDSMIDTVGEEAWRTYVIPILDLKTVVILAVPSMIMAIFGFVGLGRNLIESMSTPKRPKGREDFKGRTFNQDMKDKFFGTGKSKYNK